jgi:hypothetical protein
MTFNSSKADAQDLTASGRVVPETDPHSKKAGGILRLVTDVSGN